MRLRFLSPDKQKQESARVVGAILFFVGGMLVMSGYKTEDLFLFGVLLLVWYGMSWFAYRKNSEKPMRLILQVFYFLLFIVFSVICGIGTAYFPTLITYETLGLLINLVVMILFLILLFYRGRSSKSDTR